MRIITVIGGADWTNNSAPNDDDGGIVHANGIEHFREATDSSQCKIPSLEFTTQDSTETTFYDLLAR